MNHWQWEAEIHAQRPDGDAFNIGDLGAFDTQEAALAAASSLIGQSIGHYRTSPKAGPYEDSIQDFQVPDTSIVTGATVQRFSADGIDYASQRSIGSTA